MGAAGSISQVDWHTKYGSDVCPYIISLLRYVRNGYAGELPDSLTAEDYKQIKDNPNLFDNSLVGFVGYGCSYGGKWFAGLAKGGINRNHVSESKRNLIKLAPKLSNCLFYLGNYTQWAGYSGEVFYCDPPYGYGETVTKYKMAFDHEAFFTWAEKLAENNKVFISEYNAPANWQCIWEMESKTGIHHGFDKHPVKIERLFTI